MTLRIIAMAAVASLLASAAHAQPSDTRRADLRCMLGFMALLQNPAYKDAATAGLMYYVGRLDGREPDLELATAIKREAGNMATADYMTEAQRCGRALKERSAALKAAGEGLRSGR